MSVIITYLNDNAQIPLGRFLLYMLYSQLCNKYSDKSNRWSLSLSLCVVSSAASAITSSPSLMTLLIAVNGVPWRIFSKSIVAHIQMAHLSKTTPILGVICHPFGKTWHIFPLYKILHSRIWHSQPFLRYGWGPQNLKQVTWSNHAPFKDSGKLC